MNTEETLKEILAGVVENKFPANKINSNTNIIDEIGLDSLQMINFILMLEDEFELEIDFDEIDYEMFLEFSLLVRFINTKLAKQHL